MKDEFKLKTCIVCGRIIEPRKKWAKNWDHIKICSVRCRKNKNQSNFEKKILDLLTTRGANKTICPSEVLEFEQKNNFDMMEKVRASARLLAAKGKIAITQSGKEVDPSSFRGPIRLKLLRKDFE